MVELTHDEANLLEWLQEEEFSQYGECYGIALNGLIRKGLAVIHGAHENQSGFITQGSSLMHRAVSLTTEGKSWKLSSSSHSSSRAME